MAVNSMRHRCLWNNIGDVGGWLRLLLVALPGLFCLPFFKHCFSYINICQVPRDLLKTKVEDRVFFLTLPEGPGKC